MLTLTCGKTMLLTVLRRRWNREMTTARIDLEQMIADQLASRAEDEPHNRDAVEADMAAEIGDAVRQLREQVGLNQTQVAALMNSSQPTVNRIETGQVLATLPSLVRIVRALGLAHLYLELAPEGISIDVKKSLRPVPAQRRTR
jgi:ribosome-binding protein aMBF1 (putative translation factor)